VAIWALFPPGSSRPVAIWRSPVRSRARPMLPDGRLRRTASRHPAAGALLYLFRGALGPIFSRGTDRLTKRLEEAGIRTDVYEFTICRLIADQAIRDFRMTILRRLP